VKPKTAFLRLSPRGRRTRLPALPAPDGAPRPALALPGRGPGRRSPGGQAYFEYGDVPADIPAALVMTVDRLLGIPRCAIDLKDPRTYVFTRPGPAGALRWRREPSVPVSGPAVAPEGDVALTALADSIIRASAGTAGP
jgi:hypothetical protein